MTKNISEEELLLRKRARRRLVGAIVLVIFAVIVLPIIFDEPKPENEQHEIAINLPASDKKNNKDDLVPPKEELVGRGAFPELQDKPKINQQNIEETSETLNERKRTPIPGIKPKIDSRYSLETKNATTTTTTNVTSSAVVAATGVSKGEASKGFVIQLGAFSDQSKAKQQLENLAVNGFKAYTEALKTGNNEVTRVRMGPFMTRDAAENELKKLKKLGLDGVVTPK